MENKAIKNMEYWKKKNNIPGIEDLEQSGLTDGRAGSSAFQMKTPGSSPNKFMGSFTQGIGSLFNRSADQPKQPWWASQNPEMGNVVQPPPPAGMTPPSPGQETVDPNSVLTMRSPVKQEDDVTNPTVAGQYLEKKGDKIIDTEEGTEYVDPDGILEMDENGFIIDNDYILEGNKIIGIKETGGKESPSEEGVPMGPMGPGGMGQPTGGVM